MILSWEFIAKSLEEQSFFYYKQTSNSVKKPYFKVSSCKLELLNKYHTCQQTDQYVTYYQEYVTTKHSIIINENNNKYFQNKFFKNLFLIRNVFIYKNSYFSCYHYLKFSMF